MAAARPLKPVHRSGLNKNTALAALLLTGCLGLLVWLNLAYFMPLKHLDVPNPDNDLSVFWSGTRTVWQGGNPYDYAENGLYRQIARGAGGSVDTFVNPFYLTLIFMPLAVLSLPAAALVWLLLSEVLLGWSTIMLIKLSRGRLLPGYLLAGLAQAILWRYSFEVLILNNISLLMLFALVASFYASRTGRPFLAGAVAALLLLKPQISFLILPLLLVAPTGEPGEAGADNLPGWKDSMLSPLALRRWAGFMSAVLVFTAYSFSLRPGWIFEWLSSTSDRTTPRFDSEMTSVRSIAALLLPDSRQVQPLYFVLAALVSLVALALWWRNRNDAACFPYLLNVVIALNLLAAPYTRSYDYCMLLAPLIFGYSRFRDMEYRSNRVRRWGGTGSWRWWLPVILVWPLHLLAVNTSFAWETLVPAVLIAMTLMQWRRERKLNSNYSP